MSSLSLSCILFLLFLFFLVSSSFLRIFYVIHVFLPLPYVSLTSPSSVPVLQLLFLHLCICSPLSFSSISSSSHFSKFHLTILCLQHIDTNCRRRVATEAALQGLLVLLLSDIPMYFHGVLCIHPSPSPFPFPLHVPSSSSASSSSYSSGSTCTIQF